MSIAWSARGSGNRKSQRRFCWPRCNARSRWRADGRERCATGPGYPLPWTGPPSPTANQPRTQAGALSPNPAVQPRPAPPLRPRLPATSHGERSNFVTTRVLRPQRAQKANIHVQATRGRATTRQGDRLVRGPEARRRTRARAAPIPPLEEAAARAGARSGPPVWSAAGRGLRRQAADPGGGTHRPLPCRPTTGRSASPTSACRGRRRRQRRTV